MSRAASTPSTPEAEWTCKTGAFVPSWRAISDREAVRDAHCQHLLELDPPGDGRLLLVVATMRVKYGPESTKDVLSASPSEGLAAWSVDLAFESFQVRWRDARQVGSLREVLPEQPVGVRVGVALPEAARIAEADLDTSWPG
jgi:hypothetical protein